MFLPERNNGMNRRRVWMTLYQLLDKIGDLDEKSIPVLGFRQPSFFNSGSVPVFRFFPGHTEGNPEEIKITAKDSRE